MVNLKYQLEQNGASLVGFGNIQGLYQKVGQSVATMYDSKKNTIIVPEYPIGISIALAIPKEIIILIINWG